MRPRHDPKPAPPSSLRRVLMCMAIIAALLPLSGCSLWSRMGTDNRGIEFGKVWYLGGAGPFGHAGTIDVPDGLRRAGWKGAIEVYAWQSNLGGTLRDQMDRARNIGEARQLAARITEYQRQFPGRPVHIIALSAGTGIATWALESLPDEHHIGNVVFLSSSLSRTYDLTKAMRHIDGRLYNFFSTTDIVLLYGVPVAGSVDREFEGNEVAGAYGFKSPVNPSDEARRRYPALLVNRPYLRSYGEFGYYGGHTDATAVEFIERIVAPLAIRPSRGE